jgi:uncharacterized phage protein (TIGR01671 family)
MREILFRGKIIDNGEWVYGFYFHQKNTPIEGYFIIGSKGFLERVIPETVGQFTGLTDKNGVKIFEGDIVTSKFWNPQNYKVIFQDGEFSFTTDDLQPYTNSIHYLNDFEVIGNIHDNPELL